MSTSRSVLVTGANGFVGRIVCRDLQAAGWQVRMAVRGPDRVPRDVTGAESYLVGDLSGTTDWRQAVEGVDAVVHLAARVHQLRDSGPDALAAYRAVNTDATLALGRAALSSGVRRLVYISTIKVNGEANVGRPFRADDPPDPHDAYAVSKLEGERGLMELAASGLEVVVIRPTLVYGPGVRANFHRLMRLAGAGIPLPLGAVDNRRSLVSVWNLSSLVRRALESGQAPGRVWLVSDDQDISTADLIRLMAAAMGKPARLLPVPVGVLQALGRIAGRRDEVMRLTESLRVDISDTKSELGWVPPVSLAEGVRRTIEAERKAANG